MSRFLQWARESEHGRRTDGLVSPSTTNNSGTWIADRAGRLEAGLHQRLAQRCT
jgi:hypothetical protein